MVRKILPLLERILIDPRQTGACRPVPVVRSVQERPLNAQVSRALERLLSASPVRIGPSA